jgi:hypothetical protein
VYVATLLGKVAWDRQRHTAIKGEETMKTLVIGTLVGMLVVGWQVPSALAIHCPALVKECEALVAKLENRPSADKAQLAAAKQGCAEAMKLHDAGNHTDSLIKVGEGITQAGKAAK